MKMMRREKTLLSLPFLFVAALAIPNQFFVPSNGRSITPLTIALILLLIPSSEELVMRRQVLDLISTSVISSQSSHLLISSDVHSDGSTRAVTAPTLQDEVSDLDDVAARKQRMIERRQLMEASRSSNNRQSYLDLSRQRALLYNTTSKAVTCPSNIPCL